MAKRNRETLKNYFRHGKRPTEEQFEDLIDSSLNTLDDGLSGAPHIGIGLTPLSDDGVILSAYKKAGEIQAVWKVAVDTKNGDLHIKRCKDIYHTEDDKEEDVFILKHECEGGDAVPEIHFNGNITSKGRKGGYQTGIVPADGAWHCLLEDDGRLQEGCWAFEIMAGCGKKGSGKYALLHAVVMHCYGSKPTINVTRSHFGDFRNKLVLRWVKMKDRFTCQLQIRTRVNYGDNINIEYQITNLWDNPTMK